MAKLGRRGFLAAGGTVIAGLPVRKLYAAADLATAKLRPIDPRVAAPDIRFLQWDGTEQTLEKFRGWGMVINLWATWCAPCVAEMPALATLSKALAPHDIAVMPLSTDRGGIAVVQRFYDTHKISGLPILTTKNATAEAFGARGLPATIIIDKKGMQCAHLDGVADWSDPAIAAQIRRLVG